MSTARNASRPCQMAQGGGEIVPAENHWSGIVAFRLQSHSPVNKMFVPAPPQVYYIYYFVNLTHIRKYVHKIEIEW